MRNLDKALVALLQSVLIEEYTAFYFYRNAANYCSNVGFDKAAAYFQKESEDELVHAKKLETYLTDWNIMPVLNQIDMPESISGLKNAIKKAYDMELSLYDLYNEISQKAVAVNAELFTFLDFFRIQQQTSVAEYTTLINKLELINSDDKFQIYVFEKEEFEG